MNINAGNYRILVIEDNPGDFTLVEDFLFEQIDAPVITHAKTYKAAQQLLVDEKTVFDVILLDLSLPDKTGEPLIQDIVSISLNTPVIVLTGYSDFSFGVKSIALGISDYILKDELTSLSLFKSIIYSLERKKISSDLEISEKKYSELFHLSPLPMWVFDVESLNFVDVNEAAIRHYGYSRTDFLAMTIKDIRPESELESLNAVLKRGKTKINLFTVGIFKHRKKNGDLIDVDIQSSPITYNGSPAKIVLANDITDRLRYVKAIEHQNERLREISWIQSHVVRAPLSRIMGLIPLICEAKENNDQQMMLNYLQLSANELDEVIKSITEKTRKADYNI